MPLKKTNYTLQSDRIGTLFVKYRLVIGKYRSSQQFKRSEIEQLMSKQMSNAIPVLTVGNRRFWAYKGAVYEENESYTAQQIELLVWEREQKEKAKFERLQASYLGLSESRISDRELIPDYMKSFVFQRDQARCVKCGSNSDLQFDHIIPVSRGGATSPNNLQILCRQCNLRKSNNI